MHKVKNIQPKWDLSQVCTFFKCSKIDRTIVVLTNEVKQKWVVIVEPLSFPTNRSYNEANHSSTAEPRLASSFTPSGMLGLLSVMM